jgi:hypothetical protein
MKKLLIMVCLVCAATGMQAQVIEHDNDKENIIRSTEAGHWDFSPDWYMYLFHKNYSGAYTKWEWHGMKSGLRVHFKENKSNVKTVMPRRAAALAADIAKKAVVEKEREQIQKLNDEEVRRAADRNVDLVYSKYQDYFSDLQESIEASLQYAMDTSKGKLYPQIQDVMEQNDIVTSNIAYLRKTGPGYELENSKRDKGYREAKKLMERVSKQAYALARLAHAYCTE